MSDSPPPPAPPPAPPPEPAHDATGLELARSIARGLASTRRTARKPRKRVTEATFSSAHPDDRDPQLLDATIGRLVAEQGWSTDVRMHGVFSRWDVIVGRDVALHCKPESFDRDNARLVVRTDSTAWATNLKLLLPTVVRRLNEELGDDTVRLVDVLGPTAPSWKKGRRSVRDGRGPRVTFG
jgi:predicted nucleic acid-binding Zn ribbon protein